MRASIRYLFIFLLFLSLVLIEGSNQIVNPTYVYNSLLIEEQVALSRGAISSRPEAIFEDSDTKDVDELIVMTFNICHGVNREGEESLNSIIESIRDTQAQIIGLQEVDRFMPRSGFKDQAKEIAESLGYYFIYGETINILGVKYGNAIISKFPILEYENIKLPGDSIETRALLRANIDVEGSILKVYTTHLGLNARDRKRQIRAINLTIEQSTQPFILMGDFNGSPANEEIDSLTPMVSDIALETQKENIYTYAFYSDVPNTRIDRIYVSQDIQVIDYYVLESMVSDHSMVLGIISLNPESKEGLIAFVGNNNK